MSTGQYSDYYSSLTFVLVFSLFTSIVFMAFKDLYDYYREQSNVEKTLNNIPVEELHITEAASEEEIKSLKKAVDHTAALIESSRSLSHKRKTSYKIKSALLGVFLILSYVFYFVFMSKTSYIINTGTRLLSNIEIVSPYISDIEYKQLRSDFFSMSSRNDFDELNSALSEYADEFGIDLK